MERFTSCTVELGLYDTGAMDDSTFSSTNKQTFSNLESIRDRNESVKKFATLEPDFFLLDGTFEYYDTIDNLTEETGYMSRYFTSTIKSNFGSYHSSVGITFHFYVTLPDEIQISFLDGDSVVNEATFKPDLSKCEYIDRDEYINLLTADNLEILTAENNLLCVTQVSGINEYIYFAELLANNYNNMSITFNNVDRFVRLDYIEYGVKLVYGDNLEKKLKTASLTEEVDVFSSSLPINQCSLEVIDEQGMFDITNPKSYYQYLQKRQKFKIYETVNDVTTLVAVQYLKEWSQTKKLLASFDLQDVIGLMSETTFYGGMYEGVTASNLIKIIMDDYGFDDYTIEEDLKGIVLTGYLAKQTHREALQQVAFAIGACVSTSRITGIHIYRPLLDNQGIIDYDRKLISTAHETTQKDLVTGVSITAHSYVVESDTSNASKGDYNPGTYRVVFSNPYTNLSISGGTILASNCNYADIQVDTAGEVVITGNKYVDHGVDYTYKTDTYSSSIDENILEVTGATLVSQSNVEDLVEYIYRLKQYRLEHTLQIINEEEQVSNMYAVKVNGQYAPLLITKMQSDLTGGFTGKIEGVGYALRITDYDMLGNELYAGSEGLI